MHVLKILCKCCFSGYSNAILTTMGLSWWDNKPSLVQTYSWRRSVLVTFEHRLKHKENTPSTHSKVLLPSCHPILSLLLLRYSGKPKKKKNTKQRNDSPIIQRHCFQLLRRHRTEQRGPLSIINSPLVCFKRSAYAYFKEISSEYVMYRTCKKDWTKRISIPENWCAPRFPASAHSSLPECSVARGPGD